MKTPTTSRVIALTVPLAALPLARTHAAFDAFLKIDGVKGEATNALHRDEIEIFSFSWGVSNPAALSNHTTGSGGGKVSLDALKVDDRDSDARPDLSERTDTVTFSFEEIKVTYSPQGDDGRYKSIDDHEAVSVEIVNSLPEAD